MTDPTVDRLLIMDDEPHICAIIQRVAEPLGFEVVAITDSTLFVATFERFKPSVLITDLKMPHYDGVQLLNRMKDLGCGAKVIVISGMDQRVLSTAEKLGHSHGLEVLGALQKPFDRTALETLLRSALSEKELFSGDDLRAAIELGELVVHYQPKIARDQRAWSINEAEALVRWQHPSRGLLLPGEFLPLAEQADLVGPLTDYVLQTCVEQLSHWGERGLDLKIAANLSARLIEDLEFPDRVRQLLSQHGVPGSRLTLELTESAAMGDPIAAMDIFLRLRVSEIGLAIDDFGTGYSSLQQLYHLPFDELKIDMSFVRGLPGDEEARTIVRAIVDMGHALGMRVCAEGVETVGALGYLESIDCDRAQGFLISRPVRAAQFEQLVGPWEPQRLPCASNQGG